MLAPVEIGEGHTGPANGPRLAVHDHLELMAQARFQRRFHLNGDGSIAGAVSEGVLVRR
jgi:hypothetical protein